MAEKYKLPMAPKEQPTRPRKDPPVVPPTPIEDGAPAVPAATPEYTTQLPAALEAKDVEGMKIEFEIPGTNVYFSVNKGEWFISYPRYGSTTGFGYESVSKVDDKTFKKEHFEYRDATAKRLEGLCKAIAACGANHELAIKTILAWSDGKGDGATLTKDSKGNVDKLSRAMYLLASYTRQS